MTTGPLAYCQREHGINASIPQCASRTQRLCYDFLCFFNTLIYLPVLSIFLFCLQLENLARLNEAAVDVKSEFDDIENARTIMKDLTDLRSALQLFCKLFYLLFRVCIQCNLFRFSSFSLLSTWGSGCSQRDRVLWKMFQEESFVFDFLSLLLRILGLDRESGELPFCELNIDLSEAFPPQSLLSADRPTALRLLK